MKNKYKHNPQQSCDESWSCTKCHYPVDVDGDWGKCYVPDEVDQKLLDKKKTKELDWRDKIDWVDDWLEIDCEVIFGEKGKKTLIKFIQYLLTQQRTELLEEIKTRIDTCGGFEDDCGNLCHYDSEILEWLEEIKKL